MSIGLIDVSNHYRIPDCMHRSSFAHFFGVFKLEQEQLKKELKSQGSVFQSGLKSIDS